MWWWVHWVGFRSRCRCPMILVGLACGYLGGIKRFTLRSGLLLLAPLGLELCFGVHGFMWM